MSCDEVYPHTVSMVEIDSHKGKVSIQQLRIDELRHFYVLPFDGTSFSELNPSSAGFVGKENGNWDLKCYFH